MTSSSPPCSFENRLKNITYLITNIWNDVFPIHGSSVFFHLFTFWVEIFFTTAYKKFLLQIFWQHFIEIQKIICWKKQCFSSLFCFHPKVFNHRGISIHFPQNIKQTFYIVIFLMFSTYINQNIFLSRISSIHISSRNL